MSENFSLLQLQNQLLAEKAKQELCACNAVSERFGLSLSEGEIEELVQCRAKALRDTGRVEFGGGILPKLIYAFCDSEYVEQDNFADTLAELQDVFYYFKGESLEQYTDDELIDFMVRVFNGRAQGSIEYLMGTSLETMCRYAKGDYDATDAEEAGDLF